MVRVQLNDLVVVIVRSKNTDPPLFPSIVEGEAVILAVRSHTHAEMDGGGGSGGNKAAGQQPIDFIHGVLISIVPRAKL